MDSHRRTRNIWIGISFLLHLWAAYRTIGVWQADEHFQILEFAAYRLGFTPASSLAWEFGAEIRPGLQPFMLYVVSKWMQNLGIFQPFNVMILIRGLSALLGFLSQVFLCAVMQNQKSHKAWQATDMPWLYALFFLPLLDARFSSESVSGSFFTLGLALLLWSCSSSLSKKYIPWLWAGAGVILSLAFFARFQVAFLIIGLLFYLLLNRVQPLSLWIYLFAGALLGVTFSLYCDVWLYGHFVFTPWNYFNVNLLQHKAAEFGVLPVWGYFELFATNHSGVGLVFCLVVFLFWFFFRWHVFTFVTVPFVLVHCLIGHKETRFLFPMIHLLPIMLVEVAHRLPQFFYTQKLRQTLLVFNCIVSVVISSVALSFPLEATQILFEKRHVQETFTVLLVEGPSPFFGSLSMAFYNPAHIKPQKTTPNTVESDIKLLLAQQKAFFYMRSMRVAKLEPMPLIDSHCQLIYQSLPSWIAWFNVNHWLERTTQTQLLKCQPPVFVK